MRVLFRERAWLAEVFVVIGLLHSHSARNSLYFATDLHPKTFDPTLQNCCSKEENTQDADVITRLQLRIHHAEDYFPKMELAIRGRSAQQVQDLHCRPFSMLLRRLIGDPMSLEIGYRFRMGVHNSTQTSDKPHDSQCFLKMLAYKAKRFPTCPLHQCQTLRPQINLLAFP